MNDTKNTIKSYTGTVGVDNQVTWCIISYAAYSKYRIDGLGAGYCYCDNDPKYIYK